MAERSAAMSYRSSANEVGNMPAQGSGVPPAAE